MPNVITHQESRCKCYLFTKPKAAFYPSINLTTVGGIGTTDLLGVVSRSGTAYSMAGVVDLPIFDAGRRMGNYDTAKAKKQEFVLSYEKAVQAAFREVSDALIGHQKSKEYTDSQETPHRDVTKPKPAGEYALRGRCQPALEVLDTERQRLTAEQQLAQAERDVLTTLVQLYKALGGGWQ